MSTNDRWCPICGGAKRWFDDICLPCAITHRQRERDSR